MPTLIPVLLFAVGLVFLIKGGDWFVDGATGIARQFRLPELLIGATVVSIGTTLPEVMVSTASALSGHGEIAYGNAIGSIICNTALIAAITIAIRPGRVDAKSLRLPVALKNIVMLIAGAALIAVGANLLVDNGTLIAQALGVPESVIALTFVALGTSLPELVTAISSLAKGHGALSLGNVIGANVFNLVLVSGVSVTLAPFSVPQSAAIAGYNASLVLDIPVMLLVMALLTIPALATGKLRRTQGLALLAIYAAFCAVQFTL